MEAFDSARGSQSQCGWFAGIPPASRWIKNCSRSLARGADWWRASAAGREKYVLNKELPPMNPRFVELRCSGNAKASPAETSLAARSPSVRTSSARLAPIRSGSETLSEVGP